MTDDKLEIATKTRYALDSKKRELDGLKGLLAEARYRLARPRMKMEDCHEDPSKEEIRIGNQKVSVDKERILKFIETEIKIEEKLLNQIQEKYDKI
mgnify:CR=1 FL=1